MYLETPNIIIKTIVKWYNIFRKCCSCALCQTTKLAVEQRGVRANETFSRRARSVLREYRIDLANLPCTYRP